MVQAIINIDEEANRVINIVKAKFGLNDKSQAIEVMAHQYAEAVLEPELRPEYLQKLKKISKQKSIKVGNPSDFRKRYGLK